MTGHAMKTTMLWDSLVGKDWPTKQQLSDHRTEPPQLYPDDPHANCDMCPICEDGIIGPDGICVVCWHRG